MSLIDSTKENFKANGKKFAAYVMERNDGTLDIAIDEGKKLTIGCAVERESNGKLYCIISEPKRTILGDMTYEASCEKQAVSILGTVYTVQTCERNEIPLLVESDGLCDDSLKLITIARFEPEKDSKSDLDAVRQKVIRHEIVHAFLFESGLAENSPWAQNEEMVDWFAIQGPKIWKAWQEAGAV